MCIRVLATILFIYIVLTGNAQQYPDAQENSFPSEEVILNPTAGKKRIQEAKALGKFTPEDLKIDSGYYKGAVITLKNDTIWGSIIAPPRNAITYLQLSITFQSPLGNKYIYKPAELSGFIIYKDSVPLAFESLNNDLMMEVVPRNAMFAGEAVAIKSNRYFVQRLISGACTLYYVRRAREQGTTKIYTNNNFGSYPSIIPGQRVKYVNSQGENIEDPASVGFHLKYFYCIKKSGGNLIYINPAKAPTCFADNRELMYKVSEGTYEYADMEKIVAEYNTWKTQHVKSTEQRY